jgi:predicted DNA binding CopG/RHH family protein
MTTRKLNSEEQETLTSYERGEWQSVAKLEEDRHRYQEYAAATIESTRQVSINLSLEDFEEIQRRAQENGVPYQILIANIVHQFVADRLIEQSSHP